jgi:hypothetical protein
VRRLAAVLTAMVMTGALVLGGAGTATAQKKTFGDAGDGQYGLDLKSTTVTNKGAKIKIGFTTDVRSRKVTLWSINLDTVKGNAGPEWKVGMRTTTALKYFTLFRVQGFDDYAPAMRKCRGLEQQVTKATTRVFTIPRSCLKIRGAKPGAIRVQAAIWDEGDGYDYAGDYETFIPTWIKHG